MKKYFIFVLSTIMHIKRDDRKRRNSKHREPKKRRQEQKTGNKISKYRLEKLIARDINKLSIRVQL